MIIQIRLIANSRSALIVAIEELKRVHGEAMQGLSVPTRPGKRNEWLSYGTLVIGDAD